MSEHDSLANFDEDALLDSLNSGGGSGEARKLDEEIWVELQLGSFKRGEWSNGQSFFDGSAMVVGEDGKPISGAYVDIKAVNIPDPSNEDTDDKKDAAGCYQFYRSVHEFLPLGEEFKAKARPHQDGDFSVMVLSDGTELDRDAGFSHNAKTTVSAVRACIRFRDMLEDEGDDGKPQRTKVEGLTGERVFAKLYRKANGRAAVSSFFKECPGDVDPVYSEDLLFVD